MLPSLPGPGSPAFAELCKGLHPYGINPSNVIVDSPSSRLADVTVGIGLLDNRVSVRISSGALELFVKELLVGDEEKLIPITEFLFAALKSVDDDAVQGQATLKTSSHLKLPAGEHILLLREHIRFPEDIPAFAPEAIVYEVQPDPDSRATELKVVIAKSLTYANSLFVDISAEYGGPIDPSEIAKQMNSDGERIIETLGLKEQADLSESKTSNANSGHK
jgi:hypothetical protein